MAGTWSQRCATLASTAAVTSTRQFLESVKERRAGLTFTAREVSRVMTRESCTALWFVLTGWHSLYCTILTFQLLLSITIVISCSCMWLGAAVARWLKWSPLTRPTLIWFMISVKWAMDGPESLVTFYNIGSGDGIGPIIWSAEPAWRYWQ